MKDVVTSEVYKIWIIFLPAELTSASQEIVVSKGSLFKARFETSLVSISLAVLFAASPGEDHEKRAHYSVCEPYLQTQHMLLCYGPLTLLCCMFIYL